MSEIHQSILRELRGIEAEENVRILYACESGSRAWGFPSKDSDYDVRFVYLRRPEAYLSIFEQRDVIERPISELLDINGWDLKKGLTLFRKSNPPLLEWLQSPIRYEQNYTVADSIRKLSPLSFSPKSCIYHYLNMARGITVPICKAARSKLRNISTFSVRCSHVPGSRNTRRYHHWISMCWPWI